MGAGDADGVLILPHDGSPGLRPLENGDAPGPGGGDLRVIIVDGGSTDHELRPFDVAGLVAHMDGDAQGAQMVHRGAAGLVAALDGEAHAVKHLRQGAHGHAADTRQVDPASGGDITLNIGINMGHGVRSLPERQRPAGICLFCRNVLYYKRDCRATIFLLILCLFFAKNNRE